MNTNVQTEAYLLKVALQRPDRAGRDDRADVTIRAHEHPVARHQPIRSLEMAVVVDEIAVYADDVDVQRLARRYSARSAS
ncbi:MAG: hypothetical protein QM736_16855 [Vicinamibacterales bacterium]